jgi:hypothetical protein
MLRAGLRWTAMLTLCAGAAMGAAEDRDMGSTDLRHGFRYDPMRFVEESETLQAALVRRFVFDRATPRDDELLQAEIDKLLEQQRDDGSFGDTTEQTGARLNELHRFGFDMDSPEAQRGADALLAQYRAGKQNDEWYTGEGCLNGRALHALIRTGRLDAPETLLSLSWLAKHPDKMIGDHIGCPWTQEIIVNCVWDARDVAPMDGFIDRTFEWMGDSMSAAGQISYKDPWSFIFAAAYTGAPAGEEVVRKQLPMILRGQRPDGGWDWNSRWVFLALRNYGLFETLRGLPPLPCDWEQGQVVSLPAGSYRDLTWDGERLWTLDADAGQAVAVAPDTGDVVSTLTVPAKAQGIAAWEDALAVTVAGEPPHLVMLDPATGEERRAVELKKLSWVGSVDRVADKLWIGDDFYGCAFEVDPDAPEEAQGRGVAGPNPGSLAATPDCIWHADRMAELLIRSDAAGKLLGFADLPFGVETRGIAWDGKTLWAVDDGADRLVAISPADSSAFQARRVDTSSVSLAADGLRRDSFAVAFVEAARLLGRDVDYDTVRVLSGNAFSHRLGSAVSCAAWWHAASREHGIRDVARSLGLRARQISDEGLPRDSDDVAEMERQQHARAEKTRAALDAGEVVLTSGGWEDAVWFWPGIVTGVDEDGTLRGACLNGESDNRAGPSGAIWGISIAAPTPAPDAIDREFLRRAVRQLRGEGEPFVSDDDGVYGLAAMDRWANRMATVEHFCDPCQSREAGSAVGCAWLTAVTLTEGAAAVASYLRERADAAGPDRLPHIREAATRYGHIVALMQPALEGGPGEGYGVILGDMAKQREHADAIRAARRELAAAADSMQSALSEDGSSARPVTATP